MYRRDLRDTTVDGLLADLAVADAAVQTAPEPGGDRVAYLETREGTCDCWLLEPVDGASPADRAADDEGSTAGAGSVVDRRLTSEGVTAIRYGRADAQWVAWAPDGDRLAVVDADGRLSSVDPATGRVRQLTRGEAPDRGLAWAPDGDRVAVVTDAFSRATLAVVPADGSGIEAWADDEFLYGDPRWAAPGDGDATPADTDRPVYAVRSRHRDLFDYEAELVRVTADGPEQVFARPGVRAQCPRPRPGTTDQVAFVHDAGGYDVLALADASDPDAEPTELYAVDGAEVADPAWHPDGDRIAVTVTRDGEAHVRVLAIGDGPDPDPVGESAVAVHTAGKAYHTAPVWHGDALLAIGETARDPPAVLDVSAASDATGDEGGTSPDVAGGEGEMRSDGGETSPDATAGAHTGRQLSPSAVAGFHDRLPEPESLTYRNGGEEIHAIVHPPADDAASESVPLLVKAHGGPTSFDRYRFDWRAGYFAALGYAVIRPNYRGSDGFGRAFRMANDDDWGGGDLSDVIAAADALADAYDAVDGDRAGVYGGSGGGLMTVNALGNSDRFRAGAAFYGVYDYETFVDDTDDVGWQLLKRELGFPATDVEHYRDASPIRAVESIDEPLLVLHGEEDARVPISQSEQLVEELEAHGKRHEFQRYAGEAHGFGGREAIVDAYTRVADLFAKYLRVDPGDGSSRPHRPDEES
jgi:dipeptidyl aminopeptidase/acylaminoacyl peptidase